MNKQLAHIFDDSVCLTKRQIKDYVSNHLSEEECHAIEVHLNSCPFCSEAIEGLSLYQNEVVLAFSDLNANFIHEHFHNSMPQVHLNSIAPSANVPLSNKNKPKMQPFWLRTSMAVLVLIGFGLMWYFEAGKSKDKSEKQQQTAVAEQSQQLPPQITDESQPNFASGNDDQQAGNGGSSQKPQLLIGNDRPSGDDKEKSKESGLPKKHNKPGIFKTKPEQKKGPLINALHFKQNNITPIDPLNQSALTPEKEQAKPIDPSSQTNN